MKSFKKLIAVLLSLMMIASVVVLPAAAEGEDTTTETVTRTYNLLDMSDYALGAFDGTYPEGVSTLTAWRQNENALYDGDINIVENAEGNKVLQLDLSTATFNKSAQNTRITEYGMATVYKLKLDIPTKLIPYVTSLSMNVDKQTSGGIVYELGFTDGTNYSRHGECNNYHIATTTTGIVNRTVTPAGLYKATVYQSGGAYASLSGASTWSDNSFTSAWLVMTAYGTSTDDDGKVIVDGYINIEDITITAEGDPDILDAYTKSISIFDLSEAKVGATANDTSSVPANNSDITRWSCGNGVSSYYAGTQEIVEVDGEKALKVNFDVIGKAPSDMYGSVGVYSIKMAVPTEYAQYVTGINAEFVNNATGDLSYRMFVYDGTTYGSLQSSGRTMAKGDVSLSFTTSDFKTYGSTWGMFNNGSAAGTWSDTAGDMTYFYLTMIGVATEDGGTGYAIIKDISIEVTASQRQFDAVPVTKTFNLLDMSYSDVGAFDGLYPMGVSELTAWRQSENAFYDGDINVVENADGDKVLQLDLSTATFNKSAESTRITEYGMATVYKLKLDIPEQYRPYVTKLSMNVDKQTSGGIVYELGFTDGTNYSRHGECNNYHIATTTTGIVNKTVTPAGLYKASVYQSGGAYASLSGASTWSDMSFTSAWLVMTAYGTSTDDDGNVIVDGYINIEDITYTATATVAEWEAADAAIEANKALVNDYESSGTEVTEGAVSGTKVLNASGGAWGGAAVALSTNPYIREAKGFSFWGYNPSDSACTVKLWLSLSDGTRYIISDRCSFAAKEYKKVNVSFDSVYVDTNTSDNGGDTAGDKVSLTAKQIAKITSFVVYRRSACSVYVDDVILDFKGTKLSETVTGTNATIGVQTGDTDMSAAEPAAAELTEDGKVIIPASADTQIVELTVPAGTFTEASSFVYNTESFASTSANLMLYTDAVRDNGNAGFIKKGEKSYSETLAAGGSLETTFNFYGSSGNGYNCCTISSNTTYLGPVTDSSWIPNALRVNPTASEKATVTKVYLKVAPFGDTEAETAEYITLDTALPVVNEGVKITATVKGIGGTASLIGSRVLVGNTAEVIFTPEDGYYIDSVVATASNGEEVVIASSESVNIAGYYSFTAPAADVKITVSFGESATAVLDAAGVYSSDNASAQYTIPLVDGLAYVDSATNATLKGYGVYFTTNAALDKYGVDISDLNADYIKELKDTKHNLGDYICLLEGDEVVTVKDDKDGIKFNVDINNITSAMHDTDIIANLYVEVEYDDGTTDTIVTEFNDTLDAYIYGDAFVREFYSTVGINYTADLTADISVWQDIYDRGFDHIRLPIYAAKQLGEDGLVTEEYLTKVDTAVTNALRSGFSVVLDLHSSVAVSEDFETNSPKLIAIWDQLATRYADLPDSVAFQIINEPDVNADGATDPMSYEELMELQETVTVNIRAIEGNENRTVVVGTKTNGYWANDNFSDSLLNLGNMIIDYHYYSPMAFTHSGAEWCVDSEGNLKYPEGETDYDADNILTQMNVMLDFCAQYDGVTAWIGEWGAYRPDADAKVAYYADFAAAASDTGIAWSLWEYGAGWSPYTTANGWDADLMLALGLSVD